MKCYALDTVDSTNQVARRLIAAGTLMEPAWLWARAQTGGRGTGSRRWSAPRDAGIYLSVVQFPDVAALPQPAVWTRAAGVASVEALSACSGLPVRLKPINDLMLSGRKLGGVLSEMWMEPGRMPALIIGVGVNTRRAPRYLASASSAPACLEDYLDPAALSAVRIQELMEALVAAIMYWTAQALHSEDAVEPHWRRCLGEAWSDDPEFNR